MLGREPTGRMLPESPGCFGLRPRLAEVDFLATARTTGDGVELEAGLMERFGLEAKPTLGLLLAPLPLPPPGPCLAERTISKGAL